MIRLLKAEPVAISVFTLGMTLLITGCGSGSTQVRLMNAIDGQSSINLLVNNKTVASGVGYGAASGYASSSSGSQPVQVQTGGVTLFNQNETISGGNKNTILATLSGLTVLTDNKSTPSSGNIQIRAVNASNSALLGSAADVYIVSPGTDISSVTPDITSLNFQAASNYITKPAGSYQIEFTLAGSKLPTAINTGSQSFSSGQIRTVVSLDANGGETAILSDLN